MDIHRCQLIQLERQALEEASDSMLLVLVIRRSPADSPSGSITSSLIVLEKFNLSCCITSYQDHFTIELATCVYNAADTGV